MAKKSKAKIALISLVAAVAITTFSGCNRIKNFLGINQTTPTKPSTTQITPTNPTTPTETDGNENPSSPSKPEIDYNQYNYPTKKRATQTNYPSAETILGADFFSAQANYLQYINDGRRFVDLRAKQKIQIKYDKNLDTITKNELNNVVQMIKTQLTILNPDYEIVYEKGSPDIFDKINYKTIFVMPTSNLSSNFNPELYGQLYLSTDASPIIYASTTAENNIEVLSGSNLDPDQETYKNIGMNNFLYKSLLQCFGYSTTEQKGDMLYKQKLIFSKDTATSNPYRKVYYRYDGLENLGNFYITNQYFGISEREAQFFVQNFSKDRTFAGMYDNYCKLLQIENDIYRNFDIENEINNILASPFINNELYFGNCVSNMVYPDQILNLISYSEFGENYNIVTNQNKFSYYTCTFRGKTYEGRFYVCDTSINRYLYPSCILVFENFPITYKKTETIDFTNLLVVPSYPEQVENGKICFRQVGDEQTALKFVDQTEKYIADNNIDFVNQEIFYKDFSKFPFIADTLSSNVNTSMINNNSSNAIANEPLNFSTSGEVSKYKIRIHQNEFKKEEIIKNKEKLNDQNLGM